MRKSFKTNTADSESFALGPVTSQGPLHVELHPPGALLLREGERGATPEKESRRDVTEGMERRGWAVAAVRAGGQAQGHREIPFVLWVSPYAETLCPRHSSHHCRHPQFPGPE